jgi:hypothetical protein
MARITTSFLSFQRFSSSANFGSATFSYGHCVDQKWTSTTLSRRSLKVIVLPSRSVSVSFSSTVEPTL